MSEAATGAPATGTAKGATKIVELSTLQQSAARAVAESKATAPHVYFEADVDMRACEGLIGEADGPTLGDLLVRASGLALREAPMINAAYRDNRFELYSRVNVGFAVPSRGSVMLPVIHDADEKDLTQVASEARELSGLAREGSTTRPQLAGATFTVIMASGVERYTPIITRGQAATLGAGEVCEGAIATPDGLVCGPKLSLSLACDARIVQAGEGGDFLAAVMRHLLEPDGL